MYFTIDKYLCEYAYYICVSATSLWCKSHFCQVKFLLFKDFSISDTYFNFHSFYQILNSSSTGKKISTSTFVKKSFSVLRPGSTNFLAAARNEVGAFRRRRAEK